MATTERVTITLPKDLVRDIDKLERNRSRFIAQAVEHELLRRRREQLLLSVQHPHPDVAGLADAGLGEWAAGLPEEEGLLLDPDEGKPVRWIEGKGWVEGSARGSNEAPSSRWNSIRPSVTSSGASAPASW